MSEINNEEEKQNNDEQTSVTKTCYPPPVGGGADHEPPIGTGKGSFFLDIPNAINLASPSKEQFKGKTYNKYKFTKDDGQGGQVDKDYTGIAEVRVLTEHQNDSEVSYCIYEVPEEPDKGASIHFWITSDLHEPPDVIVDGKNGGAILTQVGLVESYSSKKKRKKYFNKFCNTPDRNLQFWKIFDKHGNSLAEAERAGEDLYYLHMFFWHSDE